MTLPRRAIGAARLDIAVFEDVEADRHSTGQALAIVIVSSMAGGAGLTSSLYNAPVLTRVVLALLLWVFWAALTYAIGVYLTPEPQTDAHVSSACSNASSSAAARAISTARRARSAIARHSVGSVSHASAEYRRAAMALFGSARDSASSTRAKQSGENV